MRVHGRYKIERRTGLEQRSYAKYESELREDFHRMCGYCGKSEAVTKKDLKLTILFPKLWQRA